jgi:MFS family permease
VAALHEFRTLDRRIWVLTAARVVVTFGVSMVMPLLAFHLNQDRHVRAVLVGLIWTVSGIAAAGVQWLAGSLADRVGRRPVMLGAMAARTVNLALMGLAIQRREPVLVIAALCVANSVLRSFFDPVASAMIADLAAGEARVAAFSLQRIGINIGWAAGVAVPSVLLATGDNYAQLFYLSAPITAAAGLALTRVRETRAAATEGLPRARRTRFADLFHIPADPAFLRFLVGTLAYFLLQVQLYQTLSMYAAQVLHLSHAQVARIYLENGIIVVALQVPAFYYIRRIGVRPALVLGSMLYAASYATVGLARGQTTLLLSVAGITLAEMVSAPSQYTAATSMAPPDRIGAYAGLFGLAQTAGQSLGPLVGGFLLDRLGDRRIWMVLPLFGVIAALTYRTRDRET